MREFRGDIYCAARRRGNLLIETDAGCARLQALFCFDGATADIYWPG